MGAPNFDTEQIAKFLNAKWGPGPQCPYCKHNEWKVINSIYQLTEFTASGLAPTNTVVPSICVYCANCGNTVLLNALAVGVVELPKEPPNVK